MKREMRFCLTIMVLGAVASMAGCTVHGGGTLTSLFSGGKVTFTLHGTLDPVTGTSTGSGELHDHSLNVDAHLDGGPFTLTEDQALEFELIAYECLSYFNVPGGPATFLSGQYTPQPTKLGPGGEFAAFVVDEGQGAKSPGDFVVVVFFGGVYDGYFDCGYLNGGNFQVRP